MLWWLLMLCHDVIVFDFIVMIDEDARRDGREQKKSLDYTVYNLTNALFLWV